MKELIETSVAFNAWSGALEVAIKFVYFNATGYFVVFLVDVAVIVFFAIFITETGSGPGPVLRYCSNLWASDQTNLNKHENRQIKKSAT